MDKQIDDRKLKPILIGAIIGAITGAGTAYLIAEKAEEKGGLKLSSGDGVKIGMTVLTFIRQLIGFV